MSSEIRVGQLISPFGPGSLYNDKYGHSYIICGLDFWLYQNYEDTPTETAFRKYTIDEPRLSELLGVSRFIQPPQYINDRNLPELSGLKVGIHRFPCWRFE